jgi:hypothetical protein
MAAEFSEQSAGPGAAAEGAGLSGDAGSQSAADAPGAESSREQVRRDLPNAPAARLARENQPTLFVTLQDISKGGCRILRKGAVDLQNGEKVQVDLWAEETNLRVSIPAQLCWVRNSEEGTQAGIRFSISNPSLLRQIETYIQSFNFKAPDDRPQPFLRQSRPSSPAPRVPPPGSGSGPTLLDLSAPLPEVRDRSAGGERRRDSAVRERIDRIADGTGIPLPTLQAWLRSPELDGPGTGSRPMDPEVWSINDKFTALMTCADLGPAEQQAFCQRYRISLEQLDRWRHALLQNRQMPEEILEDNRDLMRRHLRDQQEIQRLRHDLRMREQAAANSEKLLDLTRRLRQLWQKPGQ